MRKENFKLNYVAFIERSFEQTNALKNKQHSMLYKICKRFVLVRKNFFFFFALDLLSQTELNPKLFLTQRIIQFFLAETKAMLN